MIGKRGLAYALAFGLLAVGSLALISAFSRGGLDVVRDPGADLGIYFPRSGGPIEGAWMAAAFEAVLVREGGCLWMKNGDARHLAIWPPYSTPELADGRIRVRSHEGRVIAIEGEWFHGGGGERASPGDVPGGQVPEPCRSALYWIVSPCSALDRFCGVGRRS